MALFGVVSAARMGAVAEARPVSTDEEADVLEVVAGASVLIGTRVLPALANDAAYEARVRLLRAASKR